MQALTGPRDMAKAKREINAAGYKGEPIVVMVATDYPTLDAIALVAVDMLKQVGFNVDVVSTDWGSVVQRRANRNAPDKGAGTSSSPISMVSTRIRRPAALRGNVASAWFGWPTAPKLEGLGNAWFEQNQTV